jgi:hypothetical protein
MGFIEVVTDRLPEAAKVPVVHIDGDRRDLRLDACRGLALWFTFLDHIPNNALAWLTLRNYGFSDATEVSECLNSRKRRRSCFFEPKRSYNSGSNDLFRSSVENDREHKLRLGHQ